MADGQRQPSLLEPRIIVSIDFGTTYSGFAYVHKENPGEKLMYSGWPDEVAVNGKTYWKTSTSLWYSHTADGQLKLEDWGWPAVKRYFEAVDRSVPNAERSAVKGIQSLGNRGRPFCDPNATGSDEPLQTAAAGRLIEMFKLPLESQDTSEMIEEWRQRLPAGISPQKATTDYLAQLKGFILDVLKVRFGIHIGIEDIEWAITVPIIWNDRTKQEMRSIAQNAGLVRIPGQPDSAGSPHPFHILLEPEAASVYCQKNGESLELKDGDPFMVVDAGGGTVDIVVQTNRTGRVEEVLRSSGGYCGGGAVDKNFMGLLENRIGCFRELRKRHPWVAQNILKEFQKAKFIFSIDNLQDHILEVNATLARAWEDHDKMNGIDTGSYDELLLSSDDVKGLFDPVVDEILDLIEAQLHQLPACKVIFVVGGFSESPYLQHRIKSKFKDERIIFPKNPGSAVCLGGLSLVTEPEYQVTSRISRKTYGIAIVRPFTALDPASKKIVLDSGSFSLCDDVFLSFVKRNERIEVDKSVRHVVYPAYEQQTTALVELFSTVCESSYVDEPGVTREGHFILDIPDTRLGLDRSVEVTMFFGRSLIELKAKAVDSGGGEAQMVPVTFLYEVA